MRCARCLRCFGDALTCQKEHNSDPWDHPEDHPGGIHVSEPQRFGLSAALVSPFDERGRPDLERLVGHARAVLAEGCDSITLFGTTGEGFSIPARERGAMLGAVAGAGIPLADKVYAGVSATTVAEAAEQAELALSAGVRGLLVAPPFYLKGIDDEGLYGWFHDFLARLGSEADRKSVV